MAIHFTLKWFLAISILFVLNEIRKADANSIHVSDPLKNTAINEMFDDNTPWHPDNSNDGNPPGMSFIGTNEFISTFPQKSKIASQESLPTNHFRSRRSGDWSDTDTWESSDDNTTWENATLYPTNEAEEIQIRETHIVAINSNSTAKALIIEAGGTLTNVGTTGGYTLTISDDGTLEPDFKIYGTYVLFGKPPTFNTGAVAEVYANGLVRADENLGAQSEDFVLSSRVTFNTNSVFEWNVNKPFKTSGAVYFPNSGTKIPVFRVSKNPGDVGTGALTINGILDVNTDFTFIGGSNKIFRNGIVGRSTLTQNNTPNNRFTINGANAILGGSTLRINLSFPMYLESSVTVPKDSSVTISGANLDNNVAGNSFLIEGILDMTDKNITNTNGAINIKGIYKTTHPGGFSGGGSSIPSGIVTLQPGSTIELYAPGNQNLLVRPDFSNVIFSGSGTKRVSTAFLPKGTITIKDNAVLDGGAHIIGDGNTNLTMTDNSRLILNTIGRNPGADGIYNLTGGVVQFNNTGGTKQTIRGTTSLPVAGNSVVYNQIEVTGSNVGIGNGNINLCEGGKFTVKSGGIFEANAQSIKAVTGSANQKVIVESGAEFKSGNEHGFHGLESIVIPIGVSSIHPNITNTSIILEPNSTVNYHRSSLVHTSGLQTITATIPYQNLIISGNQEKTAQLNGTIEIIGNLTKTTDAVFKHNNSTVVFNGTNAQNYHSANPQMVFNNITNQNTVGLNIMDSLSVFRELTLGNNSKLNIKADITLQSNIKNTANVAYIPANASIHYNDYNCFIVERYIPNHPKAWQMISTPVHGNQTIHEAWQEGMVRGMNTSNNKSGEAGNTRPGYGTTITSDRSTWEADGFDLYTAAGPGLKTYNSLSNKWEGVSSTYNPVQNATGYMMMIRGDRSVITSDQAATETTLRTRGKIYAPGTLAPPTTLIPNTPGLFISVGNPYASAIDFNNTIRTNLGQSYIIWDPQLTNGAFSQYGLGAYRTISNGVVVPSSGNYTDGNIPPIQSGQAFFVQLAENAPAAGSISFTESAKTSGSSAVFRGGTFIHPDAHIRVNLYVAGNGDRILLDGNMTQFHTQYAPGLDEWDAIKMVNSGENLGIASNDKMLAIERRPLFVESDTLFYTLSGLKKQHYELEFITNKTDISGLEAFLDDIYLKSQTPLNPSGKTNVSFDVHNDPASYNKNRFRIIFKSAHAPLPVTITHFSAQLQNTEVLIKWFSENESEIEKFTVKKSRDGIQFDFLAEAQAKNGTFNEYQILDRNPVGGNNYYRLKIMNKNEKTIYSIIVKVHFHSPNSYFSLYPNPVVSGIVHVQFFNQVQGRYSMRLLNMNGQVISFKNIFYNGQKYLEIFNMNSEPPGIYSLEITQSNGEKTFLKVIH